MRYLTLFTSPLIPVYDNDGNATTYPLPFDGAGELVTTHMTWDAENRLIKGNQAVYGDAHYLYDSQFRRIARIWQPPNGAATTYTLYVYDRWNCIADYTCTPTSASVATLSRTSLWGPDLSGSMQGGGGVGGLLSVKIHDDTGRNGEYFPTYDGNGNVSEYLALDGSVAAHYDYDPFGMVGSFGAYAQVFDIRYSTKRLEFINGLYYYGYRYYDSNTGRWPSRDPIEERGGINLYGFLYNEPTNWIDKLGLILVCEDEESKKAIEDIEKKSKTGAENVKKLRDSKKTHKIRTTAGPSVNKSHDPRAARNFSPSDTTTSWNPNGEDGFSGNTVLAHELQHAADSATGYNQTGDSGGNNGSSASNGYPDNEDRAVDAQNDYSEGAKEKTPGGEDVKRDDYGDHNPEPDSRESPDPDHDPKCPCKKKKKK